VAFLHEGNELAALVHGPRQQRQPLGPLRRVVVHVPPPSDDLEQEQAEAVHVALLGDRARRQDLRRDVPGRALRSALHGGLRVGAAGEQPRDAEVGELRGEGVDRRGGRWRP
jgi:hypothetical protein